VTLGLLACTGCRDEGNWQAATVPAANKAMFNARKRRKVAIIAKPPGLMVELPRQVARG
jgi:hypothetical protein